MKKPFLFVILDGVYVLFYNYQGSHNENRKKKQTFLMLFLALPTENLFLLFSKSQLGLISFAE